MIDPSWSRDKPEGMIHSFFQALWQTKTYLPHRNKYGIFGFLWGLPIPFVTVWIHLQVADLPVSWEAIGQCFGSFPLHWLFLTHPLIFGVVFGALGTMLIEREVEIWDLFGQLRGMAFSDGLTGLHNHRAFQEHIRTEQARASRMDEPVSLLLLDIDKFKILNDKYGHPAGDEVLRDLSKRFLDSVRSYDLVCRYGGEEFAIILPGMNEKQAVETAERIRTGVGDTPFRLSDEVDVDVTISIGVAVLQSDESVPSWIARADKALYRAKDCGRNQVCTFEA